MKYLFLIFTLVFSFGLTAQEDPAKKTEVYTVVESPAEFPGGQQAMVKFIQTTLNYPMVARESGIGGKTFLKFVVNEDGGISDVEVIKGSGLGILDGEAERVVRTMPAWKPAMMSGKTVKCYFNLPISFALDEPYIVFSSSNKNENYLAAKELLLNNGKPKEIIDVLQKDVGDPDAWLILGVMHYRQKDKAEAKKYFENVKANSGSNAVVYGLCDKFLNKYFQ